MSTNRVGQCYLTKKVRRHIELMKRQGKYGHYNINKIRTRAEKKQQRLELRKAAAAKAKAEKEKNKAIKAEIKAAKQIKSQGKGA